MALPAGVTRIPRRSVTYTVQDTFPLANRLGNTAAGDVANQGNMWRSDNGTARRQAALCEGVFDSGDLMGVVLGNDCRNWVRITDNSVGDDNRTALRPNSIYWSNSGSSIDIIIPGSIFSPGDRLTYVNLGSAYVDFFILNIPVQSAGLMGTQKIRLKASNPGASFTIELNYQNPTTKTLCWHIVGTNGAVGTIFDGNPIGVS